MHFEQIQGNGIAAEIVALLYCTSEMFVTNERKGGGEMNLFES